MSWIRRAAGLPPTAAEFEEVLRNCFVKYSQELSRGSSAGLDEADSAALAEGRTRVDLLAPADITVLANGIYAGGEIKSQRDAEDTAWQLTMAVAAGSTTVTPLIEAILSDRFSRSADEAKVESILRSRCARGTPEEQALLDDNRTADSGARLTLLLARHMLEQGLCRSGRDVEEWAEMTLDVLVGGAKVSDEYPIDVAALEGVVRRRIARGTPAEQAAAAFLDRADGIAILVRDLYASRPIGLWSRRGARAFADRIVASLDDARPAGDPAEIVQLLVSANQAARRDAAWEALASSRAQ